MSDETRYAVLIDAENISPKYIQIIFDEVSNYGVSTYRRIYGDWTSTRNNRWKEVLLDNSITPIQQYSYTDGKNSSDSAMIIDAMDILYTLSVDGFVLVSSDSDFTRLASRLRESGMSVIGMGESKTPNAFISACNTFKYLDILLQSQKETEALEKEVADVPVEAPLSAAPSLSRTKSRRNKGKTDAKKATNPASTPEKETRDKKDGDIGTTPEPSVISRSEWKKRQNEPSTEAKPKSTAENAPSNGEEKAKVEKRLPRPQTTIGAVRRALRSIVRENSDEENWISLANLGNQLSKRFPDFDVRNYGHAKLVTFIESFHEFEVAHREITDGGTKQLFVRLLEEEIKAR